jgi:hypothetical protein
MKRVFSLKHLKEIDIYKQNKTFTMSRVFSITGKEKHSETIGSKMGGIVTIVVVLTVFSFAMSQYSRMMRGLDDRYSSFG